MDFNPRSRVGNDICSQSTALRQYYFNPRSRVGNDPNFLETFGGFYDFNPRSRVGNDSKKLPKQGNSKISIHVPAWGTTVTDHALHVGDAFQSTFPRGERRKSRWRGSKHFAFQSTFPRGERHRVTLSLVKTCLFQSTFPRGERHKCL